MSKSELTLKLENEIYHATRKQGTFGCFEVTIGWFGSERVDYMTYDTTGKFRCYEIKSSLSDFRSKSKITFVGDLNYYVMPYDLYETVKNEIPKHIGIWCITPYVPEKNLYVGFQCIKKPKRQERKIDTKILFESMLRSLSREADKQILAYYRSQIRFDTVQDEPEQIRLEV